MFYIYSNYFKNLNLFFRKCEQALSFVFVVSNMKPFFLSVQQGLNSNIQMSEAATRGVL